MAKEDNLEFEGEVIETLPNTTFKGSYNRSSHFWQNA